ncbi:hypothetical protein N3K66_000698 [Trichothecium roseum]|uniref:Uncharacterized protein n=1 Tax=Trichothecium roseum TaxID=47278 RepID=A0ACC0VD88_9HYPO|nr:hypothetical protein N3K66_000698 [Trichothecium roseum]
MHLMSKMPRLGGGGGPRLAPMAARSTRFPCRSSNSSRSHSRATATTTTTTTTTTTKTTASYFCSSARTRPTVPPYSATNPTNNSSTSNGSTSNSSRRSAPSRTYASERTKKWLRHEAKLFVRYAAISWGGMLCLFAIYYAVIEELLERDFPTPPEWPWRTRKQLRDAHKWSDGRHRHVTWPKTLELARNLILFIEDPDRDTGKRLPRLPGAAGEDEPGLEVPWEFVPRDISGESEEWRRGYVELVMLTAKAAEKVDGWLRDVGRNCISAPEYVIGPSNPRPKPIPPGAPKAPREEDCEIAYPPADRWYLKLLATRGLSPRQRMEAAFEYANFMELQGRADGPEALYSMALAEATRGTDPSQLPYDPKTLILKDGAVPSQNVLDAVTALANYRARQGDVAKALPVYISLLKARRSLPTSPTLPADSSPKNQKKKAASTTTPPASIVDRITDLFSPPPYPAPPPDGFSPPWRSPLERCHEASLNLYIGEILYATSSSSSPSSPSRNGDGLAWTRDGVDLAEEQLRSLPPRKPGFRPDDATRTCRECLETGLGNWSAMVAGLAREERASREARGGGGGGGIFSLWKKGKEGEEEQDGGRWEAEKAVVEDRIRRTRELVEEVVMPDEGLMKYFKA